MSIIKMNNPNTIAALQITPNFKGSEFTCQHCHKLLIDDDLVKRLQKLRDVYDIGINITSGYRCKIHNRRVGGSTKSLHIYGKAADIVLNGNTNAFQVFTEACKIFNRVGFYQSSINPNTAYLHVDIGEAGTWWLSYPVISNGKRKRTYVYYKSLSNLAKAIRNDKDRDWLSMVI